MIEATSMSNTKDGSDRECVYLFSTSIWDHQMKKKHNTGRPLSITLSVSLVRWLPTKAGKWGKQARPTNTTPSK